MRLAIEFNIPNLEEIKKAARAIFFVQNDIISPTNNTNSLTTSSPLGNLNSNIIDIVGGALVTPSLIGTSISNQFTNTDGVIPLNQLELDVLLDDLLHNDEDFL